MSCPRSSTTVWPTCCAADRAGYTLIEILVVILIISSIAGIGVGILTRGGPALDRAATLLRDHARFARSQARMYRAPSRLIITPTPGRKKAAASTSDVEIEDPTYSVRVVALRSVAEWNFDHGKAGGTRGIGGDLVGGVIDSGDRFGKGLFIPDDAPEAPGVRLDARTIPSFDLRRGFLVRCDVKLRQRGACNVVRLGETFELGVEAGGRLTGAATMSMGTAKGRRRVTVRGVRRVPLHRWFKIELACDGREIRLSLDFVLEAAEPAPEECWLDPRAVWTISDGGAPVPGAIDTVELFAFDQISAEELPQFVEVAQGPGILCFDRDGRVDRREHGGLPSYLLRLEEQEERIEFELGGLTR